jgi:hypothetical protein
MGKLTFALWEELALKNKTVRHLDFEGTTCEMNISQFCYPKELLRLLFLHPHLFVTLDIGASHLGSLVTCPHTDVTGPVSRGFF